MAHLVMSDGTGRIVVKTFISMPWTKRQRGIRRRLLFSLNSKTHVSLEDSFYPESCVFPIAMKSLV